ncbi:hypothetical protein FB446DRAFT_759660 [Lentinula raphanica]|nr:hypothetical protein FB446DRAFT_759660 [Lentinula raphanica]
MLLRYIHKASNYTNYFPSELVSSAFFNFLQSTLYSLLKTPTATMTRRPTTSRTLAIVVLGASISSSVLAAPALIPPPLLFPRLSPNPFSSKAHPPQSRSVDQISEVTMLQCRGDDHANFVLHRDGGELTIDDPGYNIDEKDATTEDMSHVEVSVSLERRTKLDSQPFRSSGSINTGGIPPDKVQEFKSKINQELDELHHLGRPLGVEWRRKSADDILETLQKDKEAINALSPRMEELLNEEHVKDSSSHDRQNQPPHNPNRRRK